MSTEEVRRIINETKRSGGKLLDLTGQGLTQWPKEIKELKNIQTLYLAYNQITEITDDIGDLTGLTTLSLAGNPIKRLPAEFWKLTNLKSLWLDEVMLDRLPEEIDLLKNLIRLALWGNKLKTLPRQIGNLANLQELYLGMNRLAFLPATIGHLNQLKVLTLDKNRLSRIPETIGQLSKIGILHLSNNQLNSLPDSLESLSSLKELYLHDNEKLNLPVEILGPTREEVIRGATPARPADILKIYVKLKITRPLNEAKLIFVGFGGVGKTSLVNRLVDNQFNPSEIKKTDGIAIQEWPIHLRNDDVHLHIWDFGGQEIMHATHQFFLTQRSLYILVLNGREGHEEVDAEYWLNLINSFAADSPVIIVLNKIREQHLPLTVVDYGKSSRTSVISSRPTALTHLSGSMN